MTAGKGGVGKTTVAAALAPGLVQRGMAAKSPGLDAQEQALLLEDLRSPCTEEVVVFHASHVSSVKGAVRSWCWTPRPLVIRCC